MKICGQELSYDLHITSQERITSKLNSYSPLGFGVVHTDHMFVMDFLNDDWISPKVIPYQHIRLDPMASVLHYGGEIFEGAKAFKHEDGELYTFRIEKNAERLNNSAARLSMPSLPIEDQVNAIHTLLDVDRNWYPDQDEASMYIRPFMIATEPALGVKPNNSFKYVVILSPSGPYYPGGFNETIKVLIQDNYHRAAPGGTGEAKAGGNYAASLVPQKMAQEHGATQVLYLDVTDTYIEEGGAMNHFHVTDRGEIIIPEFSGTILRSITSQSVLELGQVLGPPARQEKVKLEDFLNGIESGKIVEAGGLGTAAVISPVGGYVFDAKLPFIRGRPPLKVGDGEIGEITRELYELYTGIQRGKVPAPDGWLKKVEHIREVRAVH